MWLSFLFIFSMLLVLSSIVFLHNSYLLVIQLLWLPFGLFLIVFYHFFQVRIPCLYALSLHEHLQERTLDAIITRKDLPMPGEFSDHSLLISQCQLPRPPVCFADVSTRAGKASTKTASAESFWPAVCARHWHTSRRTARTILHHATRPPRKNMLRAELHVTDVSRLNPVWCRLCQDQTPNKGFWTVVLEDEAGFWSIGLDWASQEETTVRRQTK